MKNTDEEIDAPLVNNPLSEGEKRIPGFSRYAIDTDGNIRNIMTNNAIAIDAEKNKFRLTNDEGSRKWFLPTAEYLTTLFAPPAPVETTEDKFTKEIVPSDSPIIEQPKATGGAFVGGPHLDAEGNNVGEHSHQNKRAKNAKKMAEQDIRDLRTQIANGLLTFKTAGEKYGISLEHARRVYKGQYFPNVK